MKLTPASRALATIRPDAASSAGPPNIMVPKQIGEIFRPLRPSWQYSIDWVLFNSIVIPGWCASASPGISRFRARCCASPRNDRVLSLGSSRRRQALRIILQYLEHATGHRDTALIGGHLGGQEDQAAGRADHARLRYQNLADFAAVDKMSIHLNRRQRRLAGDVSRGHAAGAVRERHQQPALHQAAAIVVLVLRLDRIFMFAVDHALPKRPDQAEKPRGLDDGSAGGLEFLRGHVSHIRSFHWGDEFSFPVISSIADVL